MREKDYKLKTSLDNLVKLCQGKKNGNISQRKALGLIPSTLKRKRKKERRGGEGGESRGGERRERKIGPLSVTCKKAKIGLGI